VAPIVSTIDIARTPDVVFAYVTDPSRFTTWQENIENGCMEDGTCTVGSKCVTVRRIGGKPRRVTSEITEIDPPRTWSLRGIDGPIRAVVNVTVAPLDSGTRSQLTIAIDFEGRGIGRVLVPLLVRREARSEMPRNLKRLREHLEHGSPA
jgi:uncharacterized protein YndB with AHSA1/START domain